MDALINKVILRMNNWERLKFIVFALFSKNRAKKMFIKYYEESLSETKEE